MSPNMCLPNRMTQEPAASRCRYGQSTLGMHSPIHPIIVRLSQGAVTPRRALGRRASVQPAGRGTFTLLACPILTLSIVRRGGGALTRMPSGLNKGLHRWQPERLGKWEALCAGTGSKRSCAPARGQQERSPQGRHQSCDPSFRGDRPLRPHHALTPRSSCPAASNRAYRRDAARSRANTCRNNHWPHS